MKAMNSAYNDRPQESSRPFDADRAGFVQGEGAGVLLLLPVGLPVAVAEGEGGGVALPESETLPVALGQVPPGGPGEGKVSLGPGELLKLCGRARRLLL